MECCYLFCYFVGNKHEEEQIHFAVSEDGYNFTPLYGNKTAIVQKLGKQSVRDPFILRGQDGCFYIIGTDMRSDEGWTSNHALVTWKSTDLINWTDETIIDIRDFGGEFANTNRAWAPEVLFDEQAGKYMVYWSNSTAENDTAAIWYAHTSDFKTLSRPQPLYARSGIQTIDADIVYNAENKKYYMYFKYEEDQTIAFVTADSLTGEYRDPATVVSLAPSGVEGCEMYQIADTGTWIMIMDEYGKGRYFMQRTTDMEHFEAVKADEFSMDFSPRHGSVMQITKSEYDLLVAHSKSKTEK